MFQKYGTSVFQYDVFPKCDTGVFQWDVFPKCDTGVWPGVTHDTDRNPDTDTAARLLTVWPMTY